MVGALWKHSRLSHVAQLIARQSRLRILAHEYKPLEAVASLFAFEFNSYSNVALSSDFRLHERSDLIQSATHCLDCLACCRYGGSPTRLGFRVLRLHMLRAAPCVCVSEYLISIRVYCTASAVGCCLSQLYQHTLIPSLDLTLFGCHLWPLWHSSCLPSRSCLSWTQDGQLVAAVNSKLVSSVPIRHDFISVLLAVVLSLRFPKLYQVSSLAASPLPFTLK